MVRATFCAGEVMRGAGMRQGATRACTHAYIEFLVGARYIGELTCAPFTADHRTAHRCGADTTQHTPIAYDHTAQWDDVLAVAVRREPPPANIPRPPLPVQFKPRKVLFAPSNKDGVCVCIAAFALVDGVGGSVTPLS